MRSPAGQCKWSSILAFALATVILYGSDQWITCNVDELVKWKGRTPKLPHLRTSEDFILTALTEACQSRGVPLSQIHQPPDRRHNQRLRGASCEGELGEGEFALR